MTTSQLEYSHGVERIVGKILRLAEPKLARVLELTQLFRQTTDNAEQEEIVKVLVEIIEPELLGIAWMRGVRADEAHTTVDAEALRKVQAYRKAVGARIRSTRRRLLMTQTKLASLSSLPQSHICRLEQGKHAATQDTIKRIADALSVDPGELDPAF